MKTSETHSNMTYRIAPVNRFHGTGTGQSEKGERVEDAGNGLVRLYIDGRFVALLPKDQL